MFVIIESIRAQVRAEFQLGAWETYFYRDCVCEPCRRYFELLDACAVRMPESRLVSDTTAAPEPRMLSTDEDFRAIEPSDVEAAAAKRFFNEA